MKTATQMDIRPPWPAQLTALHSLFHLYARRCLGTGRIERNERLAWASDRVGRALTSFSDLRADEAARLIDLMKTALWQKVTPAMPRSSWRRPNRDQARAYGTAGRRDHVSKEIRLVDVPTLQLVDRLREQLGWTQQRLEAFLHSSNSPVPGGAIRTLNEANGVIWALRNMLRRAERATDNEQVDVAHTNFSLEQGSLDFGRIEEGIR